MMNGSHLILAPLLIAPFLLSGASAGLEAPSAAETWRIDSGHSSVVFRVKNRGVTYQYGRFNQISGTVEMEEEDFTKSKISLEIPTASLDTNNEGRDKHLNSPDFFNSKQFPTITFVSTEISAGEGDTFTLKGKLSLHGVTKDVEAELERTGTATGRRGTNAGAHITFHINRSDYDMKFMVPNIADEVDVMVSIMVAKR